MVGWHLLALLGVEVLLYGGIACYAHRAWEWSAASALALAVAIYLCVRIVLVAAEFILARWQGEPIPEAMAKPPWALAWMYVRELAGWIVVFSIVLPFVPARRSVIDSTPLPARAPGMLPIVLVHGLACNRGNWFWFRHQLARRGFVSYALDYTPWFASIDTYVPQLGAAIEEVCSATGAQRVIVVAHSMGGLVTRDYLERFGHDRVAHVITLGTPHQGTWMTRFGFTPNVRNMATDSAWLAALRDREGRRSHDPYRAFTCLFTYHDNLVTPQHNAVLPGARQIALSGIGHLSLALSPRVLGHVVAEIARVSNAVRAVAGAGDSSSGA
jgi:pimeloyl-ACP methyl ester carboxylesterase